MNEKPYLELPSTVSNGRNLNQLLADNQKAMSEIAHTLKGLVFLAHNEFGERRLAMFCHGVWCTVGAPEIGGLISRYFWVPFDVDPAIWSKVYQYLVGPDSSLSDMKDWKFKEEPPRRSLLSAVMPFAASLCRFLSRFRTLR
jgi:hypothetical protein